MLHLVIPKRFVVGSEKREIDCIRLDSNRLLPIVSVKGLVEQHAASMGRMAASSENKDFARHFALAVVRPTERVNDMVARSGYSACPCNEERTHRMCVQ